MTYMEDYVSNVFGVEVADLFTKKRFRDIVEARYVCMSLLKEFSGLTLRDTAEYFNLDHCTAIHGIKKVRDIYSVDKAFKAKVDRIYDAYHRGIIILPFATPDIYNSITIDGEEVTIE